MSNGDPKIMSIESRAADARVPSQRAVLRSLFLTLFLRGHSSRQLQTAKAPRSIGQKLAGTLLVYACFGGIAGLLSGQPLFMLSAYLHGLSLMFLGMFVASSAGEVLFNREEADILMHRPIDPRSLLWAKVRVLVEVSLWLAGALNLVGTIVGAISPSGGWLFVPVHAASMTMQALFCTGCVVLLYQVCLRWFGRERLDGLMTTAQVLLSLAAVLSGQLLPEAMKYLERQGGAPQTRWWAWLLPPAWFAGMDDAIAGSGARTSWLLGLTGLTATSVILWFAFGKLAQSFEAGLQVLNENTGRVRAARGQRRLDRLLDLPPLSWWLRDPRERAAFLLTAAYIVRDRDTKLRLYPAVAPFLIFPVIFMVRDISSGGDGPGQGFGIAFASAYLGLVPLMSVNLLQFSQHYRAADIFRAAPLAGPAPFCHGSRKAVLCLLTFPLAIAFTVCAWFMQRNPAEMLLLLPGVIALPLVAIIPNFNGRAVPLSQPVEQAKAASRGLTLMATMFLTIGISVVAMGAYHLGLLLPMLAVELIAVVAVYYGLHRTVTNSTWSAAD